MSGKRWAVVVLGVGALGACGGDERNVGSTLGGSASGGGGASAGSEVGGPSGGLALGGGGSSSLGGGGATSTGGGPPALDTARVRMARKIQRRFSLDDREACIARAEGGIACNFGSAQTALLDSKVDLVTASGLGYCAILDDGSVKCANATGDSAASKAFSASVTSAATLMKSGDGLIAIDAGGSVRVWNGEQETSATVPLGSTLGGPDFDVCALAPDGSVACFPYFPGDPFDKAQFDFAGTKYASISQSLMLFAGIDLQGKLRVRYELADEDKQYPMETFVQVAAYSKFWCMLRNDGTLTCDDYELAPGPAWINDVPAGEFLAVDVNENFACAVRTTGELVCWGSAAPTMADKVRLD